MSVMESAGNKLFFLPPDSADNRRTYFRAFCANPRNLRELFLIPLISLIPQYFSKKK